jgi:AcrR family transcriptional regulator
MPYTKQLSPSEIVKVAMEMVEREDTEGISLRAVASALGVKAPSLYRYFSTKNALEMAVAEGVLRSMYTELACAGAQPDPETRFKEMAAAYLRFARTRYALYAFLMQGRLRGAYGSQAGKEVWNLLLESASQISGRPDDTSAAVATWSFLHGYATLEHAGGFGKSGPLGGLELGLRAFLDGFANQQSGNAKALARQIG